jgi:hypothetical protein
LAAGEIPLKIIGLFPARNEDWVLPVTLPQLTSYVDEFIVLDGHSTDKTVALVQAAGGTVIPQDSLPMHFAGWRQTLLEAGRARGGTHFVWLDADEAFTANFKKGFRERLSAMPRGGKLVMDWICLWKDPRSMRADDSIWSKSYKDFVFCEDGASNFDATRLHEGRTPGPNTPEMSIRIPREEGAVLHFQFVPFHHFQLKQAYTRGREWILKTGPAWEINQKYIPTLDTPDARCTPLPASWIEGMTGLDSLKTDDPGPNLADLATYFDRYGIEFFEPLDIWHIPQLHAEFERRMHRAPKPSRWPSLPVRLFSHYYYALRRRLPFVNN